MGIAYPHSGDTHPGNAADLQEITEERLLADFGPCHTLVYSHEDLLSAATREAAGQSGGPARDPA